MTKKLFFGWKIIRADRTSIVAWSTAQVKYPKGRRVVPRDTMGPLAVFRTKMAAQGFLFQVGRGQFIVWGRCPDKKDPCACHPFYPKIVQCRYRPSRRTRLEMHNNDGWTGCSTNMFPSGTVLAELVTCLQ